MKQQTISDYARERGYNESSVRKAIREGKIVKGAIRGESGRYKGVYPEIADAEWQAAKNPNYQRKTQAELRGEPQGAPGVTVDSGATLTAAKTAKAVYDAKIAELDYQERVGNLVSKSAVYNELVAFGQQIREAIEAIPSRVIDDILAAPSRVEAHNVLQSAIHEALQKLSDTPKLK